MPLHTQAAAVAEYLAAMRTVPLETLAPTEFREAYLATRVPFDADLAEVRDLDADGLSCRLYRPHDARGGLLVYFHGGGWVIGDLDTHDGVCRSIASRSGHSVLAVDYRLAPEHPYPAAVDDALAATVWAHSRAANLGIDAERIAVGGDSAGGNLAAIVAQRRIAPVRFQLLVYPATDLTMSHQSHEENRDAPVLTRAVMDYFVGHYVPDPPRRSEPEASPLLVADEELVGLPPALVVTAEFDPLRDEGEAYATRLTAAGVSASAVRFIGHFHGFFSMLGILDDAEAAHALCGSVLRRHLG